MNFSRLKFQQIVSILLLCGYIVGNFSEVVTDASTDIPTKNNTTIDYKKIVQQLVVTPFVLLTIPDLTTTTIPFQLKIYQSPILQLKAPPPKV